MFMRNRIDKATKSLIALDIFKFQYQSETLPLCLKCSLYAFICFSLDSPIIKDMTINQEFEIKTNLSLLCDERLSRLSVISYFIYI